MNTSLGFQLGKLQIIGENVSPAEIIFHPGLNVVTGPSDTGKSYIYQCIDYMFGGEQPKKIEESTGYSTIHLEIHANNGKVFTLTRAIQGGGINLFEKPISSITLSDSFVEMRTLKDQHDATDSENISSFLLSLGGISQPIKIRKNTLLETVSLTFRTIYQLFFIDEERIIEDKSPIYGTHGYNNTQSKWAFHYLLTGESDNSLIALPDPKITKATDQARLSVFDQLISELEKDIKRLRESSEGIDEELSELENRISEQGVMVSISSNEIGGRQQEIQALWNQLQGVDSRIIVIDELLARFALLKSHYKTDLERLEFMSEGDFYFQQLEAVNCPLCGNPLEDHVSRQRCIERNGELIDLQIASRQESEKILLHLQDLEQTFIALENERSLLIENSKEFNRHIGELDLLLNDTLKPRLIAEKSMLDQLLKKRKAVDELDLTIKRLQELWVLRANIISKKNTDGSEQSVNKSLNSTVLRRLCDQIELILKAWKYPEIETVEFNEKTLDIQVNGKPRKSHGKGVRALFHTAFNIGLMQFSEKFDLPHPRLVIIDSPLLNFKQQRPDEEQLVSGEIKRAFFENLALTPNSQQIIIFENESVPNDLKHIIHVTEFVGRSGGGRVGFFDQMPNNPSS